VSVSIGRHLNESYGRSCGGNCHQFDWFYNENKKEKKAKEWTQKCHYLFQYVLRIFLLDMTSRNDLDFEQKMTFSSKKQLNEIIQSFEREHKVINLMFRFIFACPPVI
jgi:hypothetical protein